jgi:hypothetical protein
MPTLAVLNDALRKDQGVELLETVDLAEEFLLELGAAAEKEILPPREEGQSMQDYLASLDARDDLPEGLSARIEVTSIKQAEALSLALEKALQQRLYNQHVTGAYLEDGRAGINYFRDHVFDSLRNEEGLSNTRAGRWADTLQVTSWIYAGNNRDQYGLTSTPPTAKVFIHLYFNRLQRNASKVWSNILGVQDKSMPRISWRQLVDMRKQGVINPDAPMDHSGPAELMRRLQEIHRSLNLVMGEKPGRELDRDGTKSAPALEKLVWPDDVPISASWKGTLNSQYGDRIVFPEQVREDVIQVQYKVIFLPACKQCEAMMALIPYSESYWCTECDEPRGDGQWNAHWQRRQEDEKMGMTDWETCPDPKLDGWDPEQLEIWQGFYVRVFNTTEEVGLAEEKAEVENGMLWYHNDPKLGLDEKIGLAAERFLEKHGVVPTHVQVHKSVESDGRVVVLVRHKLAERPVEIKVLKATNVLKHHYLLYVAEEEE